MQVKGSAVAALPQFIESRFGAGAVQQWLKELTPAARDVLGRTVLPSQWYPLREVFADPLDVMCRIHFQGSVKGAWDSGVFSADTGLTGVYKFFVRAGSPSFLISKAAQIISTYYQPSKIQIVDELKTSAVVQVTEFSEMTRGIEARIGGWMHRAMEIQGCERVKVQLTQSLVKGAPHSEFRVTWA
jgi:hypothetical protein